MDNQLLKQIKELLQTELKPANKKLDTLGLDVQNLKQIQNEHTEKLDALLLDVHQLQEDQKANRDEFEDMHQLKRDMKDVKEHLGV